MNAMQSHGTGIFRVLGVLLVLTVAAAAAQVPANVYTVGAGEAFPDIQPAIDAVTTTDSVILIRPGSYGPFHVTASVPGRILITSDGTGNVSILAPNTAGIDVYNRGPGQSTEIRGIGVYMDDPYPPVLVFNCASPVVLSDLLILPLYPDGITVGGCAHVAVQRCEVRGSLDGLEATNSDVVILDSIFLGGYTLGAGTNAKVCEVVWPYPTVDPTATLETHYSAVPDLWVQRVAHPGQSFEYYLLADPLAPWYMFFSTDLGRVESAGSFVSLVGLFDASQAVLLTTGTTGPTGLASRVDVFPSDPALLGLRGVMNYLVYKPSGFYPSGIYRWSNVESFVVMP